MAFINTDCRNLGNIVHINEKSPGGLLGDGGGGGTNFSGICIFYSAHLDYFLGIKIQAVDNNPLRFSPTSEDAMRILFGPATSSYLTPQKALESSFHDLKKHQVAVFSAMQSALSQLIEDLDPKKIDAALEQDKGVGSLLRSRQARLWERYETVWKARAGKSDHGMLDVFMRLFSEAYDRTS